MVDWTEYGRMYPEQELGSGKDVVPMWQLEAGAKPWGTMAADLAKGWVNCPGTSEPSGGDDSHDWLV